MSLKNPYKVPKKMQDKYDQITALTEAVCAERLNEEYADMARRMTAALARKRPSPLTRGWAKSWACGVVYALGRVNFLFDQTQKPHIEAEELCKAFGVAKSTGGNKARQIEDMLDITLFDHTWTLPSKLGDSPTAWIIMFNGLMVDARNLPRQIQEIAFEKGLIPYIPGEK